MEKFKCCICGREFVGFGNNPWGAMYKDENGEAKDFNIKEDDRCCDECDQLYVIPGRIYKYRKNNKDN